MVSMQKMVREATEEICHTFKKAIRDTNKDCVTPHCAHHYRARYLKALLSPRIKILVDFHSWRTTVFCLCFQVRARTQPCWTDAACNKSPLVVHHEKMALSTLRALVRFP